MSTSSNQDLSPVSPIDEDHIKEMVTPEHIKQRLEAAKNKWKLEYYMEKELQVSFRSNLSHQVPCNASQHLVCLSIACSYD